jgi:hypothetical protein
MARIGDRIELTVTVEALGTRHQAGDRGTVQGVDPGGYLIARMDDGRTAFPHRDETEPAT